jgi:hypothetical protein
MEIEIGAAAEAAASYRIYSDEETAKAACKILGYIYISPKKKNAQGFYMTSLHHTQVVCTLEKTIKLVPKAIRKGGPHGACRVYFPCYADTTNISTLKFVVIIRPTTDKAKIAACDVQIPQELYGYTIDRARQVTALYFAVTNITKRLMGPLGRRLPPEIVEMVLCEFLVERGLVTWQAPQPLA